MIYSDVFKYGISIGMAILIVILAAIIYFALKQNSEKVDYKDQLEELLEDDIEDLVDTSGSRSISEKWNKYWGDLLHNSGMARYRDDSSGAGRDVLFGIVILTATTSLLFQNPLIGIAISATLSVVLIFLVRNISNKKAEAVNFQLPGFLFSLKAKIQAAETNERAMMQTIDNMPPPLQDDLMVVKTKLLSGANFTEALEALRDKTSSKDLRFLAVSMIQASTSGANLETQIDKIQEVLERRRKVSDEINRAVKSATPAIWLATLIIPGLFIQSYPSTKHFWFVEPVSWFVILIVVALYAIGMVLVKKQIDAIKNI